MGSALSEGAAAPPEDGIALKIYAGRALGQKAGGCWRLRSGEVSGFAIAATKERFMSAYWCYGSLRFCSLCFFLLFFFKGCFLLEAGAVF